jgi:hypothetical protein
VEFLRRHFSLLTCFVLGCCCAIITNCATREAAHSHSRPWCTAPTRQVEGRINNNSIACARPSISASTSATWCCCAHAYELFRRVNAPHGSTRSPQGENRSGDEIRSSSRLFRCRGCISMALKQDMFTKKLFALTQSNRSTLIMTTF